MTYNQIIVFIEGNDDERFFNRIIKPILERKYTIAIPFRYSCKKKVKVNNYLKTIGCIEYVDYIFLTDINSAPCVSAKKESKLSKYVNIDKNKIIVVIKEIESWYIAGLNVKNSEKLGIQLYNDTNNLTKEQFNKIIPKKYDDSRINFMQEILNSFQVRTAKKKNKSCEYFFNKIIE
jgi:hypothetical protein